tara:strand:- start:451 stop:1305 length:855 start_codon:yes stop_codon:yes gene_type:complete
MHYFQFNIGDYASHTSRLTPLEDLAYRRMLDLYYLNEQPLNGCVTDVAREVGLSEHVNAVEYILSKFFNKTETGFSQKRIDLEIKKYKSNAKNKSKAGKASAKARQAKASSKVAGAEQTLNTTSTDEQLNINHKPITINQETVIDNKLYMFPEFWDLYQKKKGRPKCEGLWKRLTGNEIELIFNNLPNYVLSTPEKQFRSNPETWLRNKGWNDEVINNERHEKGTPKLSAYERARAVNEQYRQPQPNECELGMGAASGNLGRTMDEGAGGKALIELDNGTFVDY